MASRELAEVDINPFSPESQSIEKTKRFSTSGERKQASAFTKHLKRNGYVIVERAINLEKVKAVRDEFHRLHKGLAKGSSEFGGFQTERLYNLVARTRVLDELLLHTDVLAIIEAHLDDQIQLSISSSVNLLPGETAQAFHRDDGYYPIARPHEPLSVNTMWAIDDFTSDNGATMIIPKSHLLADEHPPSDAAIEIAEMPAGSVMLWDGSLFHAGGSNKTKYARLGITNIYCRAWLRQQENQFLGVPPALAKELNRPLQKLVGYWVANNFLGYLNESSPSLLLKD